MPPLPAHVTLQPGEGLRAVIAQDRQVQLLTDGILATLLLMLAVVLKTLLDGGLQRELSGLGSGLFTTFVFLAGPLLMQRIFGARPVYALTDRRLILAEDDAIELHRIRRIRVWLTSISLQTDTRLVSLQHLTNAPAVARLIRDTLTR
jgi:hypothetical protein